jgi:cytochrome c-type biogenesis protein CcmH
MSEFLFYAIILSVVAIGLILRPFLKTANGFHPFTLALPVLALIGSVVLYGHVGTPSASAPGEASTPSEQPPSLDEAIAELQVRLEQAPGDVEGWMLMAQAQRARGDYAGATIALETARELAPDNANILVDLAQARSFAQGQRQLDDQSRTMLSDALRIDPNHQRGLFLAGVAAVQAGEAEQAEAYWTQLLSVLPPGSEVAVAVTEQMNRLGMSLPEAPLSLTVTVDIVDTLRDRVPGNATLFVFARATNGATVPVAVSRSVISSWPAEVSLVRNQGMAGGPSLDDVEAFNLTARISFTGVAQAQAGDLQGQKNELDTALERVDVLIDSVVESP